MLLINILHMAQPVIDKSQSFAFERSRDTAASIMSGNYYVLHAKHIDSKLQHRKAIQIGMRDNIRYIAMHE